MVDLERITGFDWDDGNTEKNARKHGVSRAEIEQVFFNEPLLLTDDPGHSGSEARFQALGQTEAGRRLHVVFTLRGDDALIRPISARDMSRKEREAYGEAA